MQLQTVRIDLGGGDHAVVYRDVLHVTARLHEAELRRHMTLVETFGQGGKVLLSELEAMAAPPKAEYLVDFAGIDDNAVNEIYILNQVVEWSLGPVDREGVDRRLTREQYKTLVKEMDRLYKPTPLPSAGEGTRA
jgi:hypothetical protein